MTHLRSALVWTFAAFGSTSSYLRDIFDFLIGCVSTAKILFGLMKSNKKERNKMEYNIIPLFISFKIRVK